MLTLINKHIFEIIEDHAEWITRDKLHEANLFSFAFFFAEENIIAVLLLPPGPEVFWVI